MLVSIRIDYCHSLYFSKPFNYPYEIFPEKGDLIFPDVLIDYGMVLEESTIKDKEFMQAFENEIFVFEKKLFTQTITQDEINIPVIQLCFKVDE